MPYTPVSGRKKKDGYVPVATKKATPTYNPDRLGLVPLSQRKKAVIPTREQIASRKETIQSAPKSLTSLLPRVLREGLFGTGQTEKIDGTTGFDTGLVGFIRPGGLGKGRDQKIIERAQALEGVGTKTDDAFAKAIQDVGEPRVSVSQMAKRPLQTPKELPPLPKLALSKEEKGAIRGIKIEEALDAILGPLDFIPGVGSVRKVGTKAAKEALTAEKAILKGVEDLPPTTVGLETKQAIKATTAPASPVVKKTEKALLAKQIRDEVRGSQYGYKAGYTDARESITSQLRNTFDNKVSQIKRANELDTLKTRIVTRDADRVKTEIVDFIKNIIPPAERGRYLATVKNARTQKDLIRAFTKIDAKANQIVLRDSITELKKTAETLSESPSVSADYRNKVSDIIGNYELTGHSDKTIAKLEATQAYLRRAEAAGEDVTMPKRILEKLEILGRTPKENLTLAKVQRLQADIKLLGQLGQTKWRTKEALYEGEKALRKQELLSSVTPINSKAFPIKEIGSKPKVWTDRYIRLRNYLLKSRVGLHTVDGFAEITGMTPMKQTLDNDFGAYLGRTVPGVPNFRKLETEMLEAGQKLTPGQRERVGVYGHKLQEDGYEKLANLGITREQADAIVLTPEEQKFYNAIRTFNDSTYEAVRKYSQDIYNVDVGKVENYMSYQTDFEAISDLEAFERFGDRTADAVANKTKTVEKGFTKSRTGAGNQKVEIDALKIAARHADDVAYMLTMGKDVKQYFEIVNSPEMRAKLGDMGTLGWLEYLDLMARKGGTSSSARIAALDILRQNLASGVLGFRLSSVAVQITSFADSMATIGLEHASRGVTSIATSREWRSFVMDNFPEIRAAVGDDVAFREFSDNFLGKAQKAGMAPLVALDGVMRSSAAAGAYQKLAREAGKIVDLANPDKKLVEEATKLMRNSQGSSFFKDQPLALTTGFGVAGNKSINKTIFTFQSFMLNRWENIERQIWRLGIKEGNYAKAGMSAFWLILFAAMAEEGIRTGVGKVTDLISANEPEERNFAVNSVSNVFEGIPVFGNLVSSINYSSNPVPVISVAEGVISGIGSVIKGKNPETQARGAAQAAGGIGALFGIPGSSQAGQLVRDLIPKANSGGGSSSSKGVKTPPGLPKLPSLGGLPTPPGLPKLPTP